MSGNMRLGDYFPTHGAKPIPFQENHENKGIEKRIREIAHTQFKYLSKENLAKVCQELKKYKTLEESLAYLEENQIQPEATIYYKLLEKDSDWLVTKYLYSQIPERCRGIQMQNFFISLSGKRGDLPAAKNAFKSVKEKDGYTYGSLLEAELRCGTLKSAKKIFQEAKELGFTKSKEDNIILYNIYIDILVKHGELEEAKDAFSESCLSYHFGAACNGEDQWPSLDLHGLSHGAGFIALLLYLEKDRDALPLLECVVGIGKVGKDNFLSFREDLIQMVKEHFPKAKEVIGSNSGLVRFENIRDESDVIDQYLKEGSPGLAMNKFKKSSFFGKITLGSCLSTKEEGHDELGILDFSKLSWGIPIILLFGKYQKEDYIPPFRCLIGGKYSKMPDYKKFRDEFLKYMKVYLPTIEVKSMHDVLRSIDFIDTREPGRSPPYSKGGTSSTF